MPGGKTDGLAEVPAPGLAGRGGAGGLEELDDAPLLAAAGGDMPGRLGILAGGLDLPAITVEPLSGKSNEVAPNGGSDNWTIAPGEDGGGERK